MRRSDFDYARGIAMILIIIGHAIGMSEFVVQIIYSFHVPLFFIISGMLMYYTNTVQKPWGYIINSWKKHLIIPTMFWEIILSIFYFIAKDISLGQLIRNSITLNFNLTVLWFIPCLLLAEAIWILLIKAWRKEIPIYVISAISIGFAIAAEIVTNLFIRRILIATVFISFGYGIEQIKPKTGKFIMSNMLSVACVILWLLSMLWNTKVDLSAGVLGNTILYYTHSLAGSTIVIGICGWLPKIFGVLGWIGRNTMGFLVTHVFIRHAIIITEQALLGYYLDGWYLAVPMILFDMLIVWVIKRFAPELFGEKRLEKRGRQK